MPETWSVITAAAVHRVHNHSAALEDNPSGGAQTRSTGRSMRSTRIHCMLPSASVRIISDCQTRERAPGRLSPSPLAQSAMLDPVNVLGPVLNPCAARHSVATIGVATAPQHSFRISCLLQAHLTHMTSKIWSRLQRRPPHLRELTVERRHRTTAADGGGLACPAITIDAPSNDT